MIKKSTSLLWMLVAVLFALPLQAQDFATKRGPSKVLKANQPSTVVKKVDAPKSKDFVPEGFSFRQAGTQATTFKAPQAKDPNSKVPMTKKGLRTPNEGLFNNRTSFSPMSFTRMASPSLILNASGEEKDAHGIITAPAEGAQKVYTRSGKAYTYSNSSVQLVDQSGNIQIVECEDGTIYFKDIVSTVSMGSWVKGTKDGNTITVPAKQPVYYSSDYQATISLRWVKKSGSDFTAYDEYSDHITFTIEDGKYKLEGTSEDIFIGYIWDDDNTITGYGDFETVYTFSHDYEAPKVVTITAPADLVTESWYIKGRQYSEQQETSFSGFVDLGFDGNDVYVKGMFTDFPDAWMKGTINGNIVTFKDLQYLGMYADTYDMYAIGTDGSNLEDFTMTFDAENKVLTSNNQLLANAATDRIYYLSWYTTFSIMHDYEAPETVTVTPPADLATETWYTMGSQVVDQAEQAFKGNITIGFDGADVYLKGMFADFPDAWMKGTIEGSTVTFNGFQYQGVAYDYDIFAIGTNGEDLENFTMTFDAENKVLKSSNQLLANAATDRIYYLRWITDLTIQAENPAKPIEELPYSNTFDTADEQGEFTILDVNNDGSTWSFYENAARYRYSATNDADDWLFSPMIKLQAGKKYRFSFDVYGKSYPERFEVYAGNAFTGEAMSIEILPATDVDWNDPKNFSNFFEVSEDGYYAIGIHCISDADQNVMMADNFLLEEINADAPQAVENFTVTPGDNVLEATISFTAPTKNNGGEDLTANLTKIEILRDGEVIKTFEDVAPGTELTYTDNDPAITYGKHVYQAIAYNAAGAGEKSAEVEVFLTTVMEIPYTADFTTEAAFGQFTFIDANNDGYTWAWNDTNHAFYRYNSDEAADDYLISAPLHLVAGKNYDITVNAGSAGYDERFEVVIGKEPTVAGLSTKVFGPVELTDEDDEPFEGVYSCTEDGTYYVAIHCISDADQYLLIINKLTVEVGAADEAPAAPALTATAGAEGAQNANIEVTAPTKTVAGQDLASIEKVEIFRDGELLTEMTGIAPGATFNYLDETVADSIHTYYAVAYNEFGIGLKSNKSSVYVGFDIPATPENFTAYDKQDKVLFSWDKVGIIGSLGGYVNPAAVDYSLYGTHVEDTWLGPMLVLDEEPFAVVRDIDNYEVEYNTEEGEQDFATWGILASNDKGESDVAAASLLVGKPYDLPVIEGFTDTSLHYFWDSNASLMVSDESTDDDGVSLMMLMEEAGKGYFNSGKLNLKNASNPTLLFDVAADGVSQVEVTGAINGEAQEVLTTVAPTGEFTTVQVPLTALKDGNYACVGISAEYANPTTFDWMTGGIEELGDVLLIDNIRIVDLLEHNLSITVSAPASVQAGKSAAITAVVKNEGEKEASGYIVTIKANGKELFAQTVDEALASYATKEFTTELATTIFDEAGNVNIVAEVSYDKDLNTANNTAETVVAIKESTAAAPTNLVAQDKGGEGVDLSWEAPSTSAMEQTEDFDNTEVFPTFSVGGITETEHNGALGNWTLYDATGIEVYTWNSSSISYDNATAPCAWQVFDPEQAGFASDNFPPHSGSQFMMSICVVPNDNGSINYTDHWLISPELPGIAQTIKFQARTITDQYGEETFEVLASTTDNKPESFKKVQDFSTSVTEWTEFSADLPADTKYFAIRHTSGDIFGLFVDDVVFTAGGADVASFNIYYEGQLIANVAGDVTTYTVGIDQITGGEHTFGVSAVYPNGQESKPATATVLVTDGIESIMVDGQPVDIYSLDGKLVRKQAKSLDGLKGVYVVNGKAVMVK
ncbi:MAG: choice-of-anchor J domain-containing protein [Prevotella sp.]|nr:choice-of-anchor J domain-containing protein [Prevotella sp.]